MKKIFQLCCSKITMLSLFMLTAAVSFAQDSTSSSSSTTTTTTSTTTPVADKMWYMQPWAWIVGAIIIILIIVLLAKGNGDKSGTSDKVTIKRTVTRESDTV